MNSLEAIKMTTALTEALKDVRFTSYDFVEKFGAALHAKGYMVVKNPNFVPATEIAVELPVAVIEPAPTPEMEPGYAEEMPI